MSLRDWLDAVKDLFGKPNPPPEPDSEKPRTVQHPWGPQKEPPVWPEKK